MKRRVLLLSLALLLQGTAGLAGSDLPQVAPQARHAYVAVLMWHDVVSGKKQVWFDTTVAELRAQLAEIRRRQFNVISLEALYKHLAEGAAVPPRPLVLTFDDNYKGIYTYAYPLLKQYRYPATFFVHTDYVGVRTVKDHCDWNELREMEQSGLIGVQSQTRSHPADIRTLSDAQLRTEFQGAKASLEKRLGQPIYALAYPEGKSDDRVARAAARYGYRIAFMEDWGSAAASPSLLQVHRYSIHRRFAQALNDVARAWKGVKMR